MTLILTLANASGAFQSSDYQLTDQRTGAPVSDRAGSKQLQASFKRLDLRMAFTRIASVGTGSAALRTIDWLAGELKALPNDSPLQEICDALKMHCDAITKPHGVRGVLELILTASTIDGPFRIAVISNIDWRKRPPTAKQKFTVGIRTIEKPFVLISGYRDSLPPLQQYRLQALARDIGKSPSEILGALAEINAIAAKGGRGYISEACWVTSQTAEGPVRRSASLNIGQHQGDIHLLQGNLDLLDFVQKNFQAAPGKEISLVQGAGVSAGPSHGTPLGPPTGEPRRFILSGSPSRGALRGPAGQRSVFVDVSQLEISLEMRCNEEVNVPFATVAMTDVGSIGKGYPSPLYPWPRLAPAFMIDQGAVPRGWEYSIGHWIEDELHHVVIAQSSRSIRNVAFLGPDDEMVIVAPMTTMEFKWAEGDIGPSATIYARVLWRSRLDGTHG
jgi:hypothetical protein